jgi:hypothetical protein
MAGDLGDFRPLPVAREVDRRSAPHRQADDAIDLLAVADATEVVAPDGLLGVAKQIGACDVMVMTGFATAQAGEIGFCPVGAGTVDAVALLVVDPVHGEAGMQSVPGGALIGMESEWCL